ncbi:hypothetical protein VKT23_009777 [Stygiomarasmius scandens]|uniref:Yeast cell wall synthesis Kre9/Knh1-like N-terminal domain-containing protein n=1 Tax=Marasmiellus scandens TaxID=2682957 RepID=A0ABR1JJ81_9AGAR
MFNKIALLAAVLPLVNALTWGAPPTDAVSTQSSTLTWTSTDSDQSFSIELNHPSLLNAIAISNNVNPGDNSITVTWPVLLVHDGQYTLQAVNVGNISDVFATSSPFNIAAAPAQSSSSGASGSGTSSGTAAATSAGTATGATTSATSPATSRASSSTTGTASNSASTSAAPSSINGGGDNGGAMSVQVNGALVALAAAGAALFAL